MTIPYEAMTVQSRHAYPGGWPMYVVCFHLPTAPSKRARVTTRIDNVTYSGPVIGYNFTRRMCEAQLFAREPTP